MVLPVPLHFDFEKEVFNFKSPFNFNLDRLQLALKPVKPTEWEYKEGGEGEGEDEDEGEGGPLGSVVPFEQLKVTVKQCREEHYAQRHSRQLADLPLVVFLENLNSLHFNHS